MYPWQLVHGSFGISGAHFGNRRSNFTLSAQKLRSYGRANVAVAAGGKVKEFMISVRNGHCYYSPRRPPKKPAYPTASYPFNIVFLNPSHC